ncbi:MAG: acyloxyacyl hydrolase, partial [Bacteroidales bacterium]|nr:acyloxyacyl hydrolase [Bacteroidales bacterium]
MKRVFFIFLIILTYINESYSQTSQAVELNAQYGKVFQINKYLDGTRTGKPVEIAKSLSARYIIHTDGSKDWHQMYNYLDYGVGLYLASYNEPVHLGNSFAFYTFIYSPILRWGQFTLKNDLAFGLSFVQKHWTLNNFQNTAIGSTLNCFVQEGFLLDFKLSERFLIGLGVNFSHISNGAIQQPNTGINSLSSQINLRYNFYDKEVKYNVERPDFEKSYDLAFSLFGAVYNDMVELDNYAFNDSRRYEERDFYAFGLTTTAYK